MSAVTVEDLATPVLSIQWHNYMPTCSSLLLLQSAVPRVQRGVQVQRSSQVQWFETEQTSAMRRGVFKTLTLYTGPPKVKSTVTCQQAA